jgi:hypothetical protein
MPTANDLIDRYTGRTTGVRPATPVRGDPACECPPACPSCGGLECLCRPRFFAGQVLTEDDLNRLENYVVAKGKLHNRYLHGPGVVCGLEVVCDFCDPGSVTVKPGYAIAPCGEDIIVCKDAKASICDLISRCKPRDGDCDPYGSQAPTQCKDGIERWVLSICYDERPSRGVQPLMSEPCSCGGSCGCGGGKQGAGCGCGGTTGGGCGCGGGRPATVPTAKSMSKAAAKYNPQCEPTLICEGFRFTASKYVDPVKRQPTDVGRFGAWGLLAGKAEQFGPLLSRLIACYLRAIEIRDAFSQVQLGDQANAAEIALAYSEYLDALREFAADLSHRCDIARQLDQLQPPKSSFTAAGSVTVSAAEWQAAFGRLNDLWLEVFRECFCSALLPPCPECETSDCIPLAVVTIDANNCRVIEICNWQAREFALTLPALYYWTSFINWSAIRDAIARLCCTGGPELWTLIFRAFDNIIKSNSSSLSSGTGVAMASTTTTQPHPATAATSAGPSTTGAGASTTDIGTSTTGTSATGAGLNSQIANGTLQALAGLIEQAARPDGMARLLSVAAPPTALGTQDVTDLQASVRELQQVVAEHKAAIERLSPRS